MMEVEMRRTLRAHPNSHLEYGKIGLSDVGY